MEKRIICNCCGREIRTENGAVREDYLPIKKEWGYFSGKDREIQECILCELCWDDISSRFRIPAAVQEVTELV